MGLPHLFNRTVILHIWWQLILIILYTTGLLCVSNFVDGWAMNFPQTLIPVLGVVTGLLLVFRTNTAYNRYWEGRNLWSSIKFSIRTLTRCIWMVEEKEHTSTEIIEKASAMNLLVAFVYATKNYIREESTYDEEDVCYLINHLPKFSTPNSNQPRSSRSSMMKGSHQKAQEIFAPENVPIELTYHIASYINKVGKLNLVDSSTVSVMNAALNNLVDCLGGFEKILCTPIPLAYSVHLHHVLWLFILVLPYQLIGILNWYTIPAVALSAYAILGTLSIGWEIENPFGYDDNDFPMELFCKVIHHEILTIIGQPKLSPELWLLSNKNRPLSPESRVTASELIQMEENKVRGLFRKRSLLKLSKSKLNLDNGTDLKSVKVSNGSLAKGESEELRSMINNEG